ncbi:MAG: hypothetical protein CL582_10265 [Alteromonadaceae bacterium]|mgnify:CR=1 FL=1|nr:hypothetical protein [Alteromonadaceae bacterium]|tara:strand:- start:793 stop:1071 length:279 start_codon:yes stop_codon:yes gene_type:complete
MYQILKNQRGFKFRIFDGMENIRHLLVEDEPGVYRGLFYQRDFNVVDNRELHIVGAYGPAIIPKYNLPNIKPDYLMVRLKNDKYTAHFHYDQ